MRCIEEFLYENIPVEREKLPRKKKETFSLDTISPFSWLMTYRMQTSWFPQNYSCYLFLIPRAQLND